MTELLRDASSAELTEWQGYWLYLAEQKARSENADGHRITWNDEE